MCLAPKKDELSNHFSEGLGEGGATQIPSDSRTCQLPSATAVGVTQIAGSLFSQ